MVLFPQGQTTWKEGREERRKDRREGRKEGMEGRKGKECKEGKEGKEGKHRTLKSGNFKAPKTEVISILKNARFTRVEAKS